MKKHIKYITVFLMVATSVCASPQEDAVYWFDSYLSTGGNMAEWVNNTPGFVQYAEALWQELQQSPRELYPHEDTNLGRWAWFVEGKEEHDRAAVSRAVGYWVFPRFIRNHMTEQEIRDHILPLNQLGHVTDIVMASQRLGTGILDDYIDGLAGTGVTGDSPNAVRYYNEFGRRVTRLTQAGNFSAAATLLDRELAGLIVIPEKTEAVKSRISDLEGQAVVLTRMAERAAKIGN